MCVPLACSALHMCDALGLWTPYQQLHLFNVGLQHTPPENDKNKVFIMLYVYNYIDYKYIQEEQPQIFLKYMKTHVL